MGHGLGCRVDATGRCAMCDDDLRTRAEQYLQDGEGDHILLIAQLLAALAAAEQREQALREQLANYAFQCPQCQRVCVRVALDYQQTRQG